MAARLDITSEFPERRDSSSFLRLFLLLSCVLFGVGSVERMTAQQHWTFDSVLSPVGMDRPFTIDPQVAFDRWGNRHFAWVSYDPNSSGYQIFYANDVTGALGAPFLATDLGTVFHDSVGVDSSMIFLLDANAHSHLLYLANVLGPNGQQIGLYYTNNRDAEFREANPVLVTNASGRYGMAVDSSGAAHIVWLEENGSGDVVIWYWDSHLPGAQKHRIDSIPCRTGRCRFSDPQVEAHGKRVDVFVRFDSGTVYHTVVSPDGTHAPPNALPVPRHDSQLVAAGTADLHLRSAVDAYGIFHLLMPCKQANASLPELLYVTNAHGTTTSVPIVVIDSSLRGFDIASDGGDRLAAVWTTHRGRFAADRPVTGLAEFRRDAGGTWLPAGRIDDLNDSSGNPGGEWRVAYRLAIRGERVSISAERFTVTNRRDTGEIRMAVFERHSARSESAYMLPDAAAPGMSVVVETFAPPNAFGSFGRDTLDPANVGLEFVDPADSARIVIGPSIVSWGGRLLSTMLFIRPDATPGDVPLRVRVGGRVGNQQIFHVVNPQRLGSDGSGRLSGGGVLGSGGIFGTRSPRGVLVVDSLVLTNGNYRAYYYDVDPALDGNQGMLPLTILARGPIVIDSTAVLTVSAPVPALESEYGIAGPGGGGGGGGMRKGGGMGFTAGGSPSDSLRIPAYDDRRIGSGSSSSGLFVAGGSIGGAHGGAARPNVPAGGGTGHPFGSSGRYGGADSLSPVLPMSTMHGDVGGYGGGTGGNIDGNHSNGGGGGGYATQGGYGGIVDNGGRPVGSSVLVPLAGGSGGGGAYSVNGRASGGGGGGGLALFSYREIHLFGEIHADGGNGLSDINEAASGGGGGSGGGVLIGAKDRLLIGPRSRISAVGGKGGDMRSGTTTASRGGDGGVGRIRVDAFIDFNDSVVQFADPPIGYSGPTTGMDGSFQSLGNESVAGFGTPGKKIRVYVRPKYGTWSYDKPRDVIVNDTGVWKVELTPAEAAGGLVYVAVMQQVENPSSDPRTARPAWVMSSAGGNIVGRAAAGFNGRSLDFGCVEYPECRTLDVVITNTGEQSDLQIYGRSLAPGSSGWFRIISQEGLLRIAPGERRVIQIQFCPQDTGIAHAELRLVTNLHPDAIRTISLSGCGISGRLNLDRDTLDLGDLCPGACIDTTILLRNTGEGRLRVTELIASEKDVRVELLDATLPIDIPVGGSRSIRLRACLKAGDGNIGITFKTETPPSLRQRSIVLRIRNVGPRPELVSNIDFGIRDLGKGDTCRLDTFRLRNLSTQYPMTVDNLSVAGSGFEVLAPAAGTVVPPDGSLDVIVRFCGGEPGDYADALSIVLRSEQCALDTAVALTGSVVRSVASLFIEVPQPQSISFGQVPVGMKSLHREVRVRNGGDGTAYGITYTVTPAEFKVEPLAPNPFDLTGQTNRIFTVNVTPTAVGPVSGTLTFRSSDGWEEQVEISATGVKPDIVTDVLQLDFGDVRKNSSTDRELRVINNGTLADTIVEVLIADSTHFIHVTPANPLMKQLLPGESTTVTLRFTPRVTGPLNDNLTVTTRRGSFVVPVALVGRGVLEQAEVDVSRLDFDCDSVVRAFTVRNAGTWPMTVDMLDLRGLNPDRFRLLDLPAPDVIPPGASKMYRVEYLPGDGTARAALVVDHSTGQIVVELHGAPCTNELMLLSFSVPHVEGTVGSVVSIPIDLHTNGPVPEDIPFRLQLVYDWSLLVPESLVRNPKVAGSEVVDGLNVREASPGVLNIDGTIRTGTGTGTLLEIPMAVLLGRTYRTDLVLSELGSDGIPENYRIAFMKGSFLATDCDTTGTIDISGRYVIKQNTPNPFDQGTTIRFEIARREHVRLLLYDASGTVRATLVDDVLDRGEHAVSIAPGAFPAGLYFYEITSGRFRDSRSMLIVE